MHLPEVLLSAARQSLSVSQGLGNELPDVFIGLWQMPSRIRPDMQASLLEAGWFSGIVNAVMHFELLHIEPYTHSSMCEQVYIDRSLQRFSQLFSDVHIEAQNNPYTQSVVELQGRYSALVPTGKDVFAGNSEHSEFDGYFMLNLQVEFDGQSDRE